MQSSRPAAFLLTVVTFAMSSPTRAAEIDWFTIDCGGTSSSTGGAFELAGTIGQPDAGPVMTGGSFALSGGFWPGVLVAGPAIPGDCDGDGDVDLDDLADLELCLLGPGGSSGTGCVCLDVDADHDVDLADFAELQILLAGN